MAGQSLSSAFKNMQKLLASMLGPEPITSHYFGQSS